MNAAEAKARSKENLPKVVDVQVAIAVVSINQAINEAINSGHFTAGRSLALPKELEIVVIDTLEKHYQELGYEVAVHDCFKSKLFQIKWGDND